MRLKILLLSIVSAIIFCFASTAQGPSQQYTDLNNITNLWADAQGVTPGSVLFISGGNNVYAGATGGCTAYGRRHLHDVWTADQRRAVMANYLYRRVYYSHANPIEYRADYEGAGRPKLWTPTSFGDLSDGRYRFVIKKDLLYPIAEKYKSLNDTDAAVDMTGVEGMHWWPNLLVEIIRAGDAMGWELAYWPKNLNMQPTSRPASMFAREVLACFAQSVIGEIRSEYVLQTGGNDRFVARILDGALECHSVNALYPRDADAVVDWLRRGVLPMYARAPGVSLYGGERPGATPPVPTGRKFYLHWQLAWAAGALDRFAKDVPHLAAEIKPAADRLMQWMVDGSYPDGSSPTLISIDDATLAAWTAAGKPPASIADLLASGKMQRHNEYDFTPWCYTPMAQARRRGIANAQLLESRMLNSIVRNAENATWLVDENNNYIMPEYRKLDELVAKKPAIAAGGVRAPGQK